MLQNQQGILQGVDKIENHLKVSTKQLTLNDAASITGYHIDDSKQVMDKLIDRYHTRLQVTENGELIYDFGNYLHRRGERTWGEWWRMVGKTLVKILVWIFKAWIALTLVVYFILFVIILIAIIIAALSGNGDNDSDSSGIGDIIGSIFRGIFIWNDISYHRETYRRTDRRGYSYKKYKPRPSSIPPKKQKSEEGKKGFTASVYDFVFGPARVKDEHLANQQEVAAFLRENQGIITTSEVVGLAGWKAEEAENFMADCLARFKGNVEISENQILYGDFVELTQSKSQEGDAKIEWYWDEYEAPYEVTGNTFWRNFGVVFMNLFNLAFASFFLYITFEESQLYPEKAQDTLLVIFLAYVPFIFSFLFFLIPSIRSMGIARKNKQRRINNIRKRLMKVIFRNYDKNIKIEELEAWVNETGKEEKLSQAEIKEVMQSVVADLWGEMEFDTTHASVTYRFRRLEDEIKEAQRLREGRNGQNLLGDVVFESDV